MTGHRKERLIIFSPYAGIWPHALSEWQLVSQISQDHFEISLISCGGVLNLHCAVMESRKIELEQPARVKASVCRKCMRCSDELFRSPYERRYLLSDYLSEEERLESQRVIQDLTATELSQFTYNQIEVGRLTAYEALIKFKKTSSDLTPSQVAFWKSSAFQGMVTLKAARKILVQEKPAIAIVYSPQYAAGSVFAELAASLGIETYFIEGSSNLAERYSALRLWSWKEHGLVNPALDKYPSDYKPTRSQTCRVLGHFKELSRASSFSVYSQKGKGKFSPRMYFNIDDNQKIILACLSSYDEAFSAFFIGAFPKSKFQGSVFADQFDWIRQTIDWVKERPDFVLIIRLHPRDFANRRESVVSEQSQIWSRLLQGLPKNVKVDYPREKIPLHDYFPHIDSFTTGWSATALEALYYGIPTVTYDASIPSYPSSIHLTGLDRNTYYDNLEIATSSNRSKSIRDKMIAWLAFSFCVGTIRVTGTILDRISLKTRIIENIVRVASRYLPRLLHWIEIRYTENNRIDLDRDRLNYLLTRRKKSLFDNDEAHPKLS